MPITYHIARDEGLLVARIPERPTLREIQEYVAATLADPAYSPSLVEIIDARALTEPEAAAVAFDAASILTSLMVPRRVFARAFVVPTALVSEIARHYQRETADAGVETRVFRDLAAATLWAQRMTARAPRPPAPMS